MLTDSLVKMKLAISLWFRRLSEKIRPAFTPGFRASTGQSRAGL